MDTDALRSRLAMILAVEQQELSDWVEVERLCRELQRELPIDVTPEVVHHYLDDADIRARDAAYADGQRREVRRFVDLGEYDDGRPIPLWGCVLVILIGAGLIMWLAL